MDRHNNTWHFDTKVIHSSQASEDWQGSTLPPIYQTASHCHPTAESLSDAFGGKNSEHIYMRLTNPTNKVLEEKLVDIENGKSAIVMSSGMAAINNSCMALLRSGDEFVASNSLFMSTYVLFANVYKKYGITCRFVESSDYEAITGAINEKTRFLYFETIGNPRMDVADIARIAAIAHDHGIPLLIDNTLATPYLCRPIDFGADIVIHSTTKYLSGHGCATGGIVIDAGNFNWDSAKFPDFKPFIDRKGPLALTDKIWREHHINFGTTQAPFHAYLTMLGLDTLAVRMERHLENCRKVADFLRGRSEVKWMYYPGHEDNQYHDIAIRQFNGKGFGALFSFGLTDQQTCFSFINNLKLVSNLANLGDCKTLVIHPYSSQYLSFPDETRKNLRISPDLIRLSVGIEHIADICNDLAQALDHL